MADSNARNLHGVGAPASPRGPSKASSMFRGFQRPTNPTDMELDQPEQADHLAAHPDQEQDVEATCVVRQLMGVEHPALPPSNSTSLRQLPRAAALMARVRAKTSEQQQQLDQNQQTSDALMSAAGESSFSLGRPSPLAAGSSAGAAAADDTSARSRLRVGQADPGAVCNVLRVSKATIEELAAAVKQQQRQQRLQLQHDTSLLPPDDELMLPGIDDKMQAVFVALANQLHNSHLAAKKLKLALKDRVLVWGSCQPNEFREELPTEADTCNLESDMDEALLGTDEVFLIKSLSAEVQEEADGCAAWPTLLKVMQEFGVHSLELPLRIAYLFDSPVDNAALCKKLKRVVRGLLQPAGLWLYSNKPACDAGTMAELLSCKLQSLEVLPVGDISATYEVAVGGGRMVSSLRVSCGAVLNDTQLLMAPTHQHFSKELSLELARMVSPHADDVLALHRLLLPRVAELVSGAWEARGSSINPSTLQPSEADLQRLFEEVATAGYKDLPFFSGAPDLRVYCSRIVQRLQGLFDVEKVCEVLPWVDMIGGRSGKEQWQATGALYDGLLYSQEMMVCIDLSRLKPLLPLKLLDSKTDWHKQVGRYAEFAVHMFYSLLLAKYPGSPALTRWLQDRMESGDQWDLQLDANAYRLLAPMSTPDSAASHRHRAVQRVEVKGTHLVSKSVSETSQLELDAAAKYGKDYTFVRVSGVPLSLTAKQQMQQSQLEAARAGMMLAGGVSRLGLQEEDEMEEGEISTGPRLLALVCKNLQQQIVKRRVVVFENTASAKGGMLVCVGSHAAVLNR